MDEILIKINEDVTIVERTRVGHNKRWGNGGNDGEGFGGLQDE